MRVPSLTVLLILLVLFSGCQNSSSNETAPEITITSNGDTIGYSVGLNQWNGAAYDREDNFIAIMEQVSVSQLHYLELGSEIEIAFEKGEEPSEVELYDYVLNEKGQAKYTYREIIQREVTFDDEVGSFVIEGHFASMLSSNSDDYMQGASIRGFKLVCTWGDNECEYGFIIRSDAG